MPATEVTHFLFEAKPLWTGQIGSGGVADGTVQTIPLQSASNLDSGDVYVVRINRVDSNGTKTTSPATNTEVLYGKLSGTNLIESVRGAEGTAQAWGAGIVVEILFTATHWNKMIEFLEVEHNAAGTHKESALDSMIAGTEAQGDIIYHNGTIWTRLAKGTDGQVLTLASSSPSWAAPAVANPLDLAQIATPANPSAGRNKIYPKSDGKFYTLTSAGVEIALSTIPRTTTEVSSATPTINTDNTDIHTITALAAAITSFTTNLSGTPVNGQKLIIRIKDDGTARAITWGASFASRGATLPTTTVLGKYHYIGLIYNSTATIWDCVAAVVEA